MVDLDLDLDLSRFRTGGRVALQDEDEFAENQRRYGYPSAVAAQAIAAAADLLRALTDRTEPFDAAHHPWLDLVSGR